MSKEDLNVNRLRPWEGFRRQGLRVLGMATRVHHWAGWIGGVRRVRCTEGVAHWSSGGLGFHSGEMQNQWRVNALN